MGKNDVPLICYFNGKLVDGDKNARYIGGCTKADMIPNRAGFTAFTEKIQEIMKLPSGGLEFKIQCGVRFDESTLIAIDVDDDKSLQFIMDRSNHSNPIRAYILENFPPMTPVIATQREMANLGQRRGGRRRGRGRNDVLTGVDTLNGQQNPPAALEAHASPMAQSDAPTLDGHKKDPLNGQQLDGDPSNGQQNPPVAPAEPSPPVRRGGRRRGQQNPPAAPAEPASLVVQLDAQQNPPVAPAEPPPPVMQVFAFNYDKFIEVDMTRTRSEIDRLSVDPLYKQVAEKHLDKWVNSLHCEQFQGEVPFFKDPQEVSQLKKRKQTQQQEEQELGEITREGKLELQRLRDVIKNNRIDINDDDNAFLEKILKSRNEEVVLGEMITVGRLKDLLHADRWIGSAVINDYIELMKKEQNSSSLKCHFFDTHFYALDLENYRTGNIEKWSKAKLNRFKDSLSNADRVFIPVHKNKNHWCLLVIHNDHKKILYVDSLPCSDGTRERNQLLQLRMDFLRAKEHGTSDLLIDSEDVQEIPKQKNGSDCGVFMLKYIDTLRKNLPLHSINSDCIPAIRIEIALQLKKLHSKW